MTVYALTPPQLAQYAAAVWPLVERGCAGGGADPREMMVMALRGDAVVWVVIHDEDIKGAVVTEVNDWPECRALRILAMGGDGMKHWIGAVVDTLKAHARANGCDRLVTEGRRGWERVLGLKPVRYVYEMGVSA